MNNPVYCRDLPYQKVRTSGATKTYYELLLHIRISDP